MEQVVIEELNRLSKEYLDNSELEKNVVFNNDFKEKQDYLKEEIATYQRKIMEYTKGIRELYLDKVKGILSQQDYLDLSNDFSVQKRRLEKLVEDKQKQLDTLKKKMMTQDNRKKLIEQYTNLEHLDRFTVEKLIDYIDIGKRNTETKELPIEIHWNF